MYQPQNLNAYSYVTNNPLIYTDPTGEDSTSFQNTFLQVFSITNVQQFNEKVQQGIVSFCNNLKELTASIVIGIVVDRIGGGEIGVDDGMVFSAIGKGGMKEAVKSTEKAVAKEAKDLIKTPKTQGISPKSPMNTNKALDKMQEFLGKGYKDMGNGRYLSKDGMKQARIGDNDILGKHAGGPHINLEQYKINPSTGKKIIDDSTKEHLFIKD